MLRPNQATLREMCAQFKKRCVPCNRTSSLKNKSQKPITPIDGKETFHHLQLDLIDFQSTPAGPKKKYKFVAHLIDHFSCFHMTKAIKYKNAETILEFLRDKFSMIGYPKILHTDNGSEFVNASVTKYLKKHGIEHRTGKAYTPQTQGKIERANRYLQELMTKQIAQSKYTKTWFDVLYESTFASNTNALSAIKKSAYTHIFCMDPVNIGDIGDFHALMAELLKKRLLQANQSVAAQNTAESKQDNEVDEHGYESPGVTTTDENYLRYQNAKRIRDDSRQNYTNNMKTMKTKHDRLRKVNMYKVGEVAGLIIPEEYVTKYANKLPVVIASVHNFGSTEMYTLAYGDKILENKYYQHELVKYAGTKDYYGVVVHHDEKEYMERMTAKAQAKSTTAIPVQTAYNSYIQMFQEAEFDADNEDTHSNNESQVEDTASELENMHDEEMKDDFASITQKIHELNSEVTQTQTEVDISNSSSNNTTPMTAIITDKQSNTKKILKVTITASKCAVCRAKIRNDAETIPCAGCGRIMHTKAQCDFAMVQYTHNHQHYCSLACNRNQVNYEIAIVGEVVVGKNKQRKYTVLYKNGFTAQIPASKVERLAQYSKMVYDWRQQHPHKEHANYNATNDVDDEVEIIASNVVAPQRCNAGSEYACCVCMEKLDPKMNPHNCHACKRPMHGHIICPKRELIYNDDGELYCNSCKNSTM